MNARDVILATLSHYVTRADAPPPGVPARPARGFETELCAICEESGVSAVIVRSLDSLALPPAISGVTAARLGRAAVGARDLSARRRRRLADLMDVLDGAGIPALVMGDARSAAGLYSDPDERAVSRLEILVDETRSAEVLGAAEAAGFSRRASDPNIDPTPLAPPTLRESRDLLEFHHYMAPLLLYNGEGDVARIRFRVVDIGPPRPRESAWERAVTVRLAGRDVRAIALEDHVVDLVVRYGISRATDLAVLTDLALVLERHRRAVSWGQVVYTARSHRIYCALGHTMERVERLLFLRRHSPLESPRPWVRRWFALFERRPGSRRPDPARDRLVYGLVACGGPVSRVRWLWRSSVPRRAWVERVVGQAHRPISWLRFQMVLGDRVRPRPRSSRRIGGDNVTRIDRKDGPS